MSQNIGDDAINPDVHMRGAVRLPQGAVRVTDADEEVFLLYTALAARKAQDGSAAFRGLGHIDSREDTLTISLKLGRTLAGHTTAPSTVRAAKRKTRNHREEDVQTLDVQIFQDKTALRSRKGDTGSVLWHASVDFAETVLQQLSSNDPAGFLDPAALSKTHVLELGAGTGLLGVVLSRFVRQYTATDIEELVPLIRKNISQNLFLSRTPPVKSKHSSEPSPSSNVTADALDWVAFRDASKHARSKLVPAEPADLVLVVDCIYHPSLLPALLTTIDYLTVPGKTAIVVVVELRAEDVVREFLQGWLEKVEEADWEIWSVCGLLDSTYAVWVGWKNKEGLDGQDVHYRRPSG